jgi:membrane protein
VKQLIPKLKGCVNEIRDFLDEKGIGAANWELSRLRRFAHFCLMVFKSFVRNRCPIRASALAYTTLLALIPMLAVAISVCGSVLKKDGTQRIYQLIDRFVASVTPPAAVSTNGNEVVAISTEDGLDFTNHGSITNLTFLAATTNSVPTDARYIAARKQVSDTIQHFIENTSSSTVGVTGMIVLVVVAIRMLSNIEDTFNDIWGVSRGRSWWSHLVQCCWRLRSACRAVRIFTPQRRPICWPDIMSSGRWYFRYFPSRSCSSAFRCFIC